MIGRASFRFTREALVWDLSRTNERASWREEEHSLTPTWMPTIWCKTRPQNINIVSIKNSSILMISDSNNFIRVRVVFTRWNMSIPNTSYLYLRWPFFFMKHMIEKSNVLMIFQEESITSVVMYMCVSGVDVAYGFALPFGTVMTMWDFFKFILYYMYHIDVLLYWYYIATLINWTHFRISFFFLILHLLKLQRYHTISRSIYT
jgi:hypothetical protein